MIDLTFEPTGKGQVICKRTRDGFSRPPFVYTSRHPMPMGMTEAQEREWNAAWDLEQGR